jgi:hypothetical protein
MDPLPFGTLHLALIFIHALTGNRVPILVVLTTIDDDRIFIDAVTTFSGTNVYVAINFKGISAD